MFVIMVYDTAAQRNPRVIKTCRRYLRWVQRSVFQGELSEAQYRSLTSELRARLDLSYDSIRVYRIRSVHDVQIDCLGQQDGHTDSVL